jgi:hypothetical protein
MPKYRKEEWIRKGFSLSTEAIDKLKEGGNFYGLKDSNYIEFLIMQQAETLNPIHQLSKSNNRIKEMREELRKEEQKNQEYANNIIKYQKWLKEKQQKKPGAISALQRKILENDDVSVERIAKQWGMRLGVSPITLIADAMENIEKSGV